MLFYVSSVHICQVPASSIQPFGDNKHGENLGVGPPSGNGATGSPSNTKSPGPRPSSIPTGTLMHAAIWPQQKWAENWGVGLRPLLGEGDWTHLTQSRLCWGLPHARYQLHTFSRLAAINMGQKFGGSAPLLGRGERDPHLTQSPGPRPTSIPSDILIHAAIWPQQIWAKN